MTRPRAPFLGRLLLTREFFAQALLFALPIGIATALAVAWFYHFDVQIAERNLRETEQLHLRMREATLRHNVETAMAGLRLLTNIQDPPGTMFHEGDRSQRALVSGFLLLCRQYAAYRQIRSVLASGREEARVLCRPQHPIAVPPRRLQERVDAMLQRHLPGLAQGDVYLSSIVMDLAEDDAALAAEPLIRIATPLQSRGTGERRFVVIDTDLRRIIAHEMDTAGRGATMLLVEEDGRFLQRSDPGGQWGDTLRPGRELRFEREYPEVWPGLHAARDGVIETSAGLFTFLTLDLAHLLQVRRNRIGIVTDAPIDAPEWKLVSYVPHARIAAGRTASALKFILLIPAPLLVTLYLAHVVVRRRRAVRDLVESERYLRQIMDSVVDGIVTTDPAGRIERANAGVLALFGFASQAELPRELGQLLPLERLDPRGELLRLWRGGDAAQRSARAELELNRRDGSAFPAELVVMDAELAGGRRFVWIIRDIRERHASEAKQTAERMRFFHQTKMAEIGLIAAGIIHEVGNPIAAIAGMVSQLSEAMREERGGQKTRDTLDLIAQQVQRLSGITREISDFVRTSPGDVELFDLNSLVRSTLRLVRYDGRWKSIRLELQLDPEIPAIMGIQDQVAQVLMNLLVNAGDAVQERPPGERWVAVRTEHRSTHVVLSVIDNGHGMSEEIKQRAFDSFYTTKPEGKGTGLGLSLCQSIVAAHQGLIEVESGQGRGAVFRVSLPVPATTRSLTG